MKSKLALYDLPSPLVAFAPPPSSWSTLCMLCVVLTTYVLCHLMYCTSLRVVIHFGLFYSFGSHECE